MIIPPALGVRYTVKAIWLGILAAILLGIGVFGIVQTVRIEGAKFLFIEIEGWKPKAKRLSADLDHVIEAQMEAKALAIEAKVETEKSYRDLAQEIDDHAKTERELELARAKRFVASRVRKRASGGSSRRSAAPSTDNSAENGNGAGEAPIVDDTEGMVLVEGEDVLICTANTLQAEAARDWALGLMANSQGE